MHSNTRRRTRFFAVKDPEVVLALVLMVAGLTLAALLVLTGHATKGMSLFLFLNVDLLGFIAVAGGLLLLWAGRRWLVQHVHGAVSGALGRVRPWHAALVVLAVTVTGVSAVHHDYAFSMDEYMTRFQARIFSTGAVSGTIPAEWRDDARALHHNFAPIQPVTGRVISGYRPGMAALTALFDLFGLGSYVSAILSALSVLMAAAVARRIWPASREAPVVAALLLATSQQVLATGLTSYAMPAHLFFNLLWLWLFLRDDRLGHILAPLIGVWTAGLHQVHMHIVFALPFLLTLFSPPRFRLLAYYGVVYVAGHVAVVSWVTAAFGTPGAAASAAAASGAAASTAVGALASLLNHVGSIARLPGSFELSSVAANLARLMAWQNLALPVLIVLALWRAADRPPAIRLLIASLGVSLLPYLFLMPDQGHGWGYRYFHGLIGNLVLIGTAGWLALRQLDDEARRRATAFVAASTVLTVVVMLPLRGIQIERIVRPFADAQAYVGSRDADVVAIDGRGVFYAWDLGRNDPFLRNRPVIVNLDRLDTPRLDRLCRRYSVAIISNAELQSFGMLPALTDTVPTIPPSCRPGMRPTLSPARRP